ncbi:MAG: nucleotidyltransferase domain-containing protein [candidate division WOR-3 bacterium]
MLTNNEKLNRLLPEIEKKIRESFGEKVTKIILFGSFARGDYHKYSDVDILVIVDDEDLIKYRKKRPDIILDIINKYDLFLSIRIVKARIFNSYREISGFYSDVIKEGLIIYG